MKKSKVLLGIVFILSLTVIVSSSAAGYADDGLAKPGMTKLDPMLRLLLRLTRPATEIQAPVPPPPRREGADQLLSSEVLPLSVTLLEEMSKVFGIHMGELQPTVDVLIKTTGDTKELSELGAKVQSRIGDVVTANVPIGSLEDIARLQNVVYIEASRIMEATNDVSVPETGATQARADFGVSGTGVVVGYIDSGIDFTHEDFRNPDGSTRIKYLLDFSDPGDLNSDGTLDGPDDFGGTLYTEADINAALVANGSVFPYLGSPRNIPDGRSTGIRASIHVDQDLIVESLAVDVEIWHSNIGDLKVTLTSPAGTSVMLHDRTGGEGNDIVGVFVVDRFNGESSQGYWSLRVSDHSTGHEGSLRSWALRINQVVRQEDNVGHGSHGAGSAAGNGRGTGHGVPAGTYTGMAPEADLIVVKGTRTDGGGFYTSDTVNALSFIDQKAGELREPYVVNMSFGGQFGPHDGTTLHEQAIDNLVGPGKPGKAVVVSAGNEGDEDIHSSGTVPSEGTEEVSFEVPSAPSGYYAVVRIDIWYEGSDSFGVGYERPDGYTRSRTISPGQDGVCYAPWDYSYIICIESSLNNPDNRDKEIYLLLLAISRHSGEWKFILHGDTVLNGRFDAWSLGAEFISDVDPSMRVAMPGTAHSAITVGAYVTKDEWVDVNGSRRRCVDYLDAEACPPFGEMASFSSDGPTRDGRLKPEITAPGQWIASTYSSQAPSGSTFSMFPSDEWIMQDTKHGASLGTSFSAPHVAGAVALIFDMEPSLDVIEVRDLLERNARTDVFTGAVPNDEWGYGKLGVWGAIRELVPTGLPGDCNGDGVVDAGDISACVLEIFDGDGSNPADTPGGTFPGNPGCDANEDDIVDAGDISCTVLLIFSGPGACGGGGGPTSATGLPVSFGPAAISAGPALAIPDRVPASPGGRVTLPINFTANGHSISSLIFSVDYDQTWLTFDPTDSNGDGIPDAVTFNLPGAFNASVTFDPNDTDGELDFFIADLFPPLAALPDGAIVSIALDVASPLSTTEAMVRFSQDPPASFGDTSGQSVPGTTDDGSVLIAVAGPALAIPDQVPASPGGRVTVPVNFTAHGHSISSLVFSVDYDQTWLSFDPTDSNGDGIPDAVTFSVPGAFNASVTFDPNDIDGELDFFIADLFPPLATLPDGPIVSIALGVGSPPSTTEAAVRFSQDPAASFGDTSGQSVPGTTDDGSVLITTERRKAIHLPLLASNYSPGPTPTPTTITPTPTPTTVTPTPTPTIVTPTPTPTTVTPTPTPTTVTLTPTPTIVTPTRTATPTATQTPGRGIYGHLTYQGQAAANIALSLLRWDDPRTATTIASTVTDSSGAYSFTNVPTLPAEKTYRVRFWNGSHDERYLLVWDGREITSYTMGGTVFGGDFDLANIPLVSPTEGATVSLPVTFDWDAREISGDQYTWLIKAPGEPYVLASSGSLGTSTEYTLESPPPGLEYGREYIWYIQVLNGDNGYGLSLYRYISFAALATPTQTPATTPTPTATPTEEAPKAIVACSRDKSICIIDLATDTVQGCFLRPLGKGSALLDVVVTPDGRTALVSNFEGNIIYFIDLTAPTPEVLGSAPIGFSAEDIALSPDGRWALVTDGRGSDRVAVIDVLNRRRAHILVGPNARAVAVAADGETVLVADTGNDRVHLLHLDPEDGTLTNPFQFLATGPGPINIAISPDGRTALVANFWDDTVTVLRIDGPGEVVRIGELGDLPGWQQSIAFSPDGRRAYVVSVAPDPDQLSVLNVNGPGDIIDSGIRIDLRTRISSGFYGVDTLAISPDGGKAYVGNPGTQGDTVDEVTVVDLIGHRVTGQISVGRYPVGIAFFTR